jgi:hypothetical protein
MTLGDGSAAPRAGDVVTVSVNEAGAEAQSVPLTVWHQVVTQTFPLNGQPFTITLQDATGYENVYLISGQAKCTTSSGLAG